MTHSTDTWDTPHAVVYFRTRSIGSYRWLRRGQKRGRWQVVIVAAGNRCHDMRGKGNRLVYTSGWGISGVSSRSRYCLDVEARLAYFLVAGLNGDGAAYSVLRSDPLAVRLMGSALAEEPIR